MRDLNEIQVFVAVADLRSFDAAARKLGLSGSTVSRRIAQLERRLGVALLQRTTRSVRLTSAGETYREHCAAVLTAAAQAEEAVAPHRSDLRGDLCVNAPILFGQRVLAPIASVFSAAHPGLRLRIELTNVRVDPVETGCDLVIRTGELPDSTLKARLLGKACCVVVGSPALIAVYGEPTEWPDLAGKPCLVFGPAGERRWRSPCLPVDALVVNTALTSNDLDVLRSAAIAGAGFAILPRFLVQDALDAGQLVALPLSATVPPTKLHAIFPNHAIPNPGARALAQMLAEHLVTSPEWIVSPVLV